MKYLGCFLVCVLFVMQLHQRCWRLLTVGERQDAMSKDDKLGVQRGGDVEPSSSNERPVVLDKSEHENGPTIEQETLQWPLRRPVRCIPAIGDEVISS